MAFTVGNQRDIFSKLKNMAPAKRLDMFKSAQSAGDASPFSSLTPAEFAALFPHYYRDKLPDVGGFYKALSNKQDSEGKTYGPHGEAGSAAVGTNEKVTNTVRAKEIYDYLRLKGVDHTHAVGIVNNMKYESNFNSGAIGDHGTSGGLFQHHASRFSAMKEYVGDGWQTNWRKQIDFALTEGEMKTYLGRNYANPADASVGFTTHFEKPANTDATATYRSGTANGYASAMEGKGGEPSGGQTAGGNYDITSSGFVVPRNKGLYDQGNEEQCATLAKGFNPDIGRSHSWTVVPGQIKPGMTVATMRYNLPGGDRTGSGYHTGVAMSAPDADGNFLLLEQFSGRKPQVRQVNAKSYDGGAMGGKTEFGIIQSNGRLHDEQSTEALSFGASVANEDQRKMIQDNIKSVTSGNTAGSDQGAGNVSVNQNPDTPAGTPGPQTNLQQQETVKSIHTATIGDVMRFAGDMAGFFSGGEGLGGRGRKGRHANAAARQIDPAAGSVTTAPTSPLAPVEGLLSFISQGEGGYNAVNQGTRGKKVLGSSNDSTRIIGRKLEEMTVGEIMKMQEGSIKTGRQIFAAGRYQIIPKTMKAAVARSGIDLNAKFDKETQDKLGMALIQGRSRLHAYLTGKSDDVHAAQADMAQEWRSIPHPKTGRAVGGGPNKAHHSVESVKNALVAARTEISNRAPIQVAQAPRKEMGPLMSEATQQTATVAAPPKTIMEKVRGYLPFAQPSVAAPAAKVEPANQTQAAPSPEPAKPATPPPAAPANQDLNLFSPTPINPANIKGKDKQSFEMNLLPNQPQKQVSIDGGMHMIDRQFSSPSLERAMKNLTNTSGASDGHFGGNNLA